MEKKNVGILMDHPYFVKSIREKLKLNLIKIKIEDIDLMSKTTIQSFNYKNNKIDALIIYGHYGKGNRQNLYDAKWLRRFRLAGYDTPIVLLVWERPSRVWASNFADNVFVSPYYKDSCRILQLPISFDLLLNELESIQTISENQLNEGRKFALHSWISHRLSHILIMDNLEYSKSQIKEFKDDISYLNEEVKFLELLLQFEDVNELKNSIRNFLKNN